MDRPSLQEIKTHFRNLSQSMKVAYSSDKTAKVIENIGQQSGFNQDQIKELADETGFLILGIRDIDQYISNLSKRLQITKDQAQIISQEIKNLIIKPAQNQTDSDTKNSLDQKTEPEIDNKDGDHLDKLPPAIRQIAESQSTLDTVRLIGGRHQLHVDQIGQLADETIKVITGQTRPYNYVNNLERQLEINHDLANDIAKDINQQIFEPIRDQLKQVHKIGPEKTTAPPPATTKPADIDKQTETIEAKLDDQDIGHDQPKPRPVNGQAVSPESQKSDQLDNETTARDLFKAKLSGLYQDQTENNQESDKNSTKPDSQYSDQDPYREPIE